MDTASKWAKQRVAVRTWCDRLWLRVEDDVTDTQSRLIHVRTKELVPGHGMGLAVVNDLVASHHGELKLSHGGLGGAVMEIMLPAA